VSYFTVLLYLQTLMLPVGFWQSHAVRKLQVSVAAWEFLGSTLQH